MGIARTYALQARGLAAEIIAVEVDISNGLNSFSIVGLGDRAVNEARDRISAAIKNSGFASPKQKNQKVVISLAPADCPKGGASFDHAMTIAYLVAAGHLPEPPAKTIFFGETSLAGELRRCPDLPQLIHSAESAGFSRIFMPAENETEARLALEHGLCDSRKTSIYAVVKITDTINHLLGKKLLEPLNLSDACQRRASENLNKEAEPEADFADIRGNPRAKRALEIAISGFHHCLLYGPPGTGKTLLAKGCASISPDLENEHAAEVASIHAAAGALSERRIHRPPFRAPHHTASYAAVVGGGPQPRPGEIALAHRGMLFMDEFPEFSPLVLEGLRQPLEEGAVTISRASRTVAFPARFLLIAAMNPCPCGRGTGGGCVCSNSSLEKYRRRISGPIADRIDLWIPVDAVPYEELCLPRMTEKNLSDKRTGERAGEPSGTIRARIRRTRDAQRKRFSDRGIDKYFNGEMGPADISKTANMSTGAAETLEAYARAHSISGRAAHRIIKVSRTIADMEQSGQVLKKHVLEALSYRKIL